MEILKIVQTIFFFVSLITFTFAKGEAQIFWGFMMLFWLILLFH